MNKGKIYIDYDKYLDMDINIEKYYKINKKAYKIFHSSKGFMHMKITNDKGIKEIEYQPYTVLKNIKSKAKKVLELGCGQCANLKFLAPKRRDITFTGVDLLPSPCNEENVEVRQMDYHSLKEFDDDTFDIVYAFETLCYSTEKLKVFKEVYRVLKKGGLFIIFDGYSLIDRVNNTEDDAKIMKVVERGMVVNSFEIYDNIEKYAKKVGFSIENKTDLSENILPNMYHFKRMAKIVVENKTLSKIISKIFPSEFIGNILAGYFMPYTIENKLFCYMENIFKK